MCEIGIICEVRDDRARVKIGDMVTDFLPVFQSLASSYAVSFSPIRVGEQVLVIPVRASLNSGVILRGIFQDSFKLNANDKKLYMVFEDGVNISYDTSSSTLNISSPKQINITCENASLEAKNVNVTADNTTIRSPNIKLLGNTIIQGSISTAGSGGGSGSFNITGDLNINGSITTSGNASFGGSVSDSRGDLTNHTNNGFARD